MRKILSAILSLLIIFGNSSGIYAQEDTPEELTAAIISVKEKIGVPDEYTEFNYSLDDSEGKNIYNLEWNTKEKEPDGGTDTILASADAKGNIYSYDLYKCGDDSHSFGKNKSYGECVFAAQEFLKKVMPQNYSEFKPIGETNGWLLTFRQYKDGVPVRANTVTMHIDRETLEILNYNFPGADRLNRNFPENGKGMTAEEAAEIIINEGLIKPEYVLNYRWKSRGAEEKNVMLAYRPERFEKTAIDANTGEIIKWTEENYYGMYDEGAKMRSSASGDAAAEESIALSDAETAEIETTKALLSKEDADKEIRGAVPEGTDLGDIVNARLSKDFIDEDKYIWSIEYSDGYASIDAKEKRLICFYKYNYNDYDEEDGEYESESGEYENIIKAKAEEYIEKNAGDKISSIKFSEERSSYGDLVYIRQVNGLDFCQNKIRVSFDGEEIDGYSYTWYDSIVFPGTENVIKAEDIFKELEKTSEFGLCYEINEKEYTDKDAGYDNNCVLAYSFIYTDKFSPYIDAKTGEELNYNGEKYEREFSAPESYPDIAGHPCEKYVNALLNEGIFIKREKFLPDEKITKSEFSQFYRVFDSETGKSLKNDESFITRREMSGLLCSVLGYEKITKKDIFKNPFSDVSDSDGELGSMVIINSLGIMKDESGMFYPDREITNAEAAEIIYFLAEFISGLR